MLYSRYENDKDGKRVRKDSKKIQEQEAPKPQNSQKHRKSNSENMKKEAPKKAPKKDLKKKAE